MEGTRLVISPLMRLRPRQDRGVGQQGLRSGSPSASDASARRSQWLDPVHGGAFTHLYTGRPAGDRTGLLTTILAAATNLGKTKGRRHGLVYGRPACPDRGLVHLRAQLRPRTGRNRLFAGTDSVVSQWGTGRTSSSDGQAFPIACRKPVIAQVNAKYGRDPVAMFYTHVSDRYAPFHTQAISSTVRDATYVLDGLLITTPRLKSKNTTLTPRATPTICSLFAICWVSDLRPGSAIWLITGCSASSHRHDIRHWRR